MIPLSQAEDKAVVLKSLACTYCKFLFAARNTGLAAARRFGPDILDLTKKLRQNLASPFDETHSDDCDSDDCSSNHYESDDCRDDSGGSVRGKGRGADANGTGTKRSRGIPTITTTSSTKSNRELGVLCSEIQKTTWREYATNRKDVNHYSEKAFRASFPEKEQILKRLRAWEERYEKTLLMGSVESEDEEEVERGSDVDDEDDEEPEGGEDEGADEAPIPRISTLILLMKDPSTGVVSDVPNTYENNDIDDPDGGKVASETNCCGKRRFPYLATCVVVVAVAVVANYVAR